MKGGVGQIAADGMDNELVFRILLFILFAGFIAHRGYYTRKLSRPAEETLEQRPGCWLPRLAGLLSIPGGIALAVYLIHPAWIAWASLPFPNWLRWAGVGVALAGFALLQWAHLALGRNWSDKPRLVVDQTLVTDGPYRWVRHPIYAAFLLIMSATLLISANWLVGFPWIGATALDVISRIHYEEALLTERFGDVYLAYAAQTGRLLPRLF